MSPYVGATEGPSNIERAGILLRLSYNEVLAGCEPSGFLLHDYHVSMGGQAECCLPMYVVEGLVCHQSVCSMVPSPNVAALKALQMEGNLVGSCCNNGLQAPFGLGLLSSTAQLTSPGARISLRKRAKVLPRWVWTERQGIGAGEMH